MKCCQGLYTVPVIMSIAGPKEPDDCRFYSIVELPTVGGGGGVVEF